VGTLVTCGKTPTTVTQGCQTSLSAKYFPWFCYQNWVCLWSLQNILLYLRFSGVFENSWKVVKLFKDELLITLNIQESRLNNIIETNHVLICSILNSCVVKSKPFARTVCIVLYWVTSSLPQARRLNLSMHRSNMQYANTW